jgi:hypothetical protein
MAYFQLERCVEDVQDAASYLAVALEANPPANKLQEAQQARLSLLFNWKDDLHRIIDRFNTQLGDFRERHASKAEVYTAGGSLCVTGGQYPNPSIPAKVVLSSHYTCSIGTSHFGRVCLDISLAARGGDKDVDSIPGTVSTMLQYLSLRDSKFSSSLEVLSLESKLFFHSHEMEEDSFPDSLNPTNAFYQETVLPTIRKGADAFLRTRP